MASTIDLLMGCGTARRCEIDNHNVRLTREMNVKAYEYWKRVKGDRAMPSRKDISPQGQPMREFIRHIGPRRDPHRVAWRADLFRPPRRGQDRERLRLHHGRCKYLNEFLPPQIEARWQTLFSAPQGTKAPVRFASRVMFGNRDYLANELLAAPLGEGEEVSMIFVSVDIWPAVGAEPGKPRTA